MAQKFLTNVELEAGLVDGSNSTGTSGYLLSSTGTATSWVDPAAVSVGESEQVHIACKNTSGVAISKGDPVYITGTVGTSFKIQIAAADASNSSKMPAVGLAETDLAHNAEGFVIVSGVLKNLTTDPLSTSDGTPSSNDTVYVKAGGGLTRTRPTGSGNLIQNVGKVGRVNSANAGSLAVSTIMRTNDVPNLTTGKIWVGSPTYTTESTVVHLDETNGRMGIGTTSPGSELDVSSSSTSIIRLSNSDTALTEGQKTGSLEFYQSDTSGNGTGVTGRISMSSAKNGSNENYYGNAADMIFQVAAPAGFASDNATLNALTIKNSSGNVGIGTTSPDYLLDVEGSVNNADIAIRINNTFDDNLATSNPTSVLWLNAVSNNGYLRVHGAPANTAAKHQIDLGSTAGSSFLTFSPGGSERMRIATDGKVGIGTTAPSSPLNIRSTGNRQIHLSDTSDSISQGLFLGYDSAGNVLSYIGSSYNSDVSRIDFRMKGLAEGDSKMSILGSGNVGIGTINPSQKLHVSSGTTNQVARFESTDGTAYLSIMDSNTTYSLQGIGSVGDELTFYSNNAERMRIDSGGNVGIGTTSPAGPLTIANANNGNWNDGLIIDDPTGWAATVYKRSNVPKMFTGLYSGNDNYIWMSTGYNNAGTTITAPRTDAVLMARPGTDDLQIYLDTHFGGNVGIGTTSPSEKLEVSGNVKMAETSAATDTDKFVVLDSGVLKYRTGAEVLADIGAQPSIVAPNAPTNLTTTIVNSTINVTFTASTTSGIDYYLVFSSVDGGDYGLISVIPPADFGATMSIIDDSFDATGTQAYRVYAVKNGVYSSPLTGNKSFSVTTPLEPTNMSVVNLNTAYYVQWDPPSANTRFVTAYNVYKHESATQASLSRSSATLVYSGMNTSYMYQISGNNNNNFHQFWVETTIA